MMVSSWGFEPAKVMSIVIWRIKCWRSYGGYKVLMPNKLLVHCNVQEGHMVDKVIVFKKLMVGSRSTKGRVYGGHMVDIR